jgi:hypothetical protein
MSILRVVLRSLQEMFWPKRFLPFLVLFFTLGIAAYLLILPIITLFFNSELVATTATFLLVDMGILFFVFLFGLLVNLWFTAALIESIKSRGDFTSSLTKVKKSYLQLIALGVVFVLLCLVSNIFGTYNNLARLLLDCVLLFSMPAVVLGAVSFEKGIKKSFEIFRKKFLETVAFWFINRFILFVIFFIGIVILSLSMAPLIASTMTIEEIQEMSTSTATMLQVVEMVTGNFPLMLLMILIASFFVSIMIVFDYTSRTYYFLELTKGRAKKRKKTRRKKKRRKR